MAADCVPFFYHPLNPFKKTPLMNLKNLLWCVALWWCVSLNVSAQNNAWPNKVIKIVVPFVPGSFTDTAARVLSVELSKQVGQTVIVDNKGGAGSTLGTDQVAKSAPDGYTFLLTDNSFAVSTALYDKLPYNPVKDIAQVTLVAESPAVLVARPGLNLKSLKDIVQFGQKNQNALTYGSGGIGSSAHLAMEAFLTQNSVQLTHIPFKGIAGAITDVTADRVDLAIGSVGSAQAYIKEGRLQGIAVSGTQRSPLLPQVPTFAESGFGNYKMMYWFGLMTPTGVPKDIIDRMQKEVVHALTQTKVQEIFAAAGVKPASNTPTEYANLVREESAMWAEVIKKAGLKSLTSQ
jgi:tripartite-type tricarboxylate transporter receptor subunit TctC